MANILGYVGEVVSSGKAQEFTQSNPDKLYQAGDEVGLAGIEQLFEDILRGVPELKVVEIDANNRVIRDREILQEAVPGQDIFLAIDIDKQYIAEEILKEELALADARKACNDSNCLPHNAKADRWSPSTSTTEPSRRWPRSQATTQRAWSMA
ncbi:MAG: hypothetical protein R2706_11125 [Acidimicrobiales bacterium]